MANVVAFVGSPLAPFVGTWIRDPISVSRNKVARRLLGAEGFERLWACASIDALRESLDSDPDLAERYRRCGELAQGQLVITTGQLIFVDEGPGHPTPRTKAHSVASVAREGTSVIVRSSEGAGRPGWVLRMRQGWLLASERYFGAQARIFPRSPVFRYHRAD
jgi:hypothetical protein